MSGRSFPRFLTVFDPPRRIPVAPRDPRKDTTMNDEHGKPIPRTTKKPRTLEGWVNVLERRDGSIMFGGDDTEDRVMRSAIYFDLCRARENAAPSCIGQARVTFTEGVQINGPGEIVWSDPDGGEARAAERADIAENLRDEGFIAAAEHVRDGAGTIHARRTAEASLDTYEGMEIMALAVAPSVARDLVQRARHAEVMEQALRHAAVVFDHYAKLHIDKRTAEGNVKADRNSDLASRMLEAIAAPAWLVGQHEHDAQLDAARARLAKHPMTEAAVLQALGTPPVPVKGDDHA